MAQAQPVDSAPLLSTLVQSGAALVAIVGGLLAARLVALVSERVALERRVRELAQLDQKRDGDLAAARKAVLDDDGADFVEAIFDSYVENLTRDFEDLFSEHGNESLTRGEMRPYFDGFVLQVAELEDELNVANLIDEGRPDDWDELRGELLLKVKGQFRQRIAEGILVGVERDWRSRRPRAPLGFEGMDMSLLAKINDPLRATRYAIESNYRRDLERNVMSAEAAKAASELEVTQARQALSLLSKPEGLGPALLVLAGIAIGGIVLPLMQLTFGSSGLSTLNRAMYVGAFILSLVVFFFYLWFEMRRVVKVPKGVLDGNSAST
ncbi:hypothetical protein [Actinokineospora sp. HUAS TT18]|uniref:hypothetical protein n=1 Tax=Actinokineospora sp. HUAS TT18 TaxID=3447451 RepID=UPI003F527D52